MLWVVRCSGFGDKGACMQNTERVPMVRELAADSVATRTRLFVVLSAIFCTCLVVGDIIGGKLIETRVFGQVFRITVGMIPFPVTFLLTDALNEFYGKRAARFVTWVGFGMAALAYVFIYVAAAIPIASITRAGTRPSTCATC